MQRTLGSFVAAVLLLSGAARVRAEDSALDALKKQVEQMQQQMQEMQQKIKELEAARPSRRDAPMSSSAQTAAPPVAVPAPALPVAPAPPWSPAQPIRLLGSSANYINLSLVGDVAFGFSTTPDVEAIEGAHHDPSQRGFTLQAAELTLDGAVDPYFKALATIPLVLEPGGETVIELEEAWVQTTSLPWNLQVKAGQMFANFGRQNTQHAHAWAFVDQPLVITRLLSGDGLRNPGAQLSWLAPTPFYTDLTLGIFNSDGATAASFRNEGEDDGTGTRRFLGRATTPRPLRGPQDMLVVPHLTSAFDLSETHTLVLGASAAFGPNDTGAHTATQIYGVDLYWKWRPVNARQGFPFVSWQTEGLFRRYEAGADPTANGGLGLPAETLKDYGLYTQLLYGFHLGWVAGLRAEFMTGNPGANDVNEPEARGDRFRLSPNLTYYPTEFSRLRLQYNFDHGQAFGDEHAVWLQLEFLIGAHGAHKF